MKRIKNGLWKGETWPEAIRLSKETKDCGICPIIGLNNKIIGYEIYGYGNGKRYSHKIPSTYHHVVNNIIA